LKECKDFQKMLCDYLDGDLKEDDCKQFEDHLKECKNCSHIVDDIRNIVDICNREATLKIPKYMKTKLIDFINSNLTKEKE